MPGRLLQLDVENFRSLRKVSLPLGDLTVLVGPNAVGKTNVLKVFGFLAEIVRTDLEPALEAQGGFDEAVFWGGDRPPSSLRIGVKANWTRYASPTAPDAYDLVVQRRAHPGDAERHIMLRRESFQFKRTRGRGRRITVSGERATVTDTRPSRGMTRSEIGIRKLSSGLSTLPRLASTEGGTEVAHVAEQLSSFRVFDVGVARARRPMRMRQDRLTNQLDSDAGNLASFLFGLWTRHVGRDESEWSQLVEDARTVLPYLEDIGFEPVGGDAEGIAVVLRERGLRRPTPLADASYGTVRLLGLLAMLYDPDPPALTCVEEIDHGLHPQALELLVERLREASQRSQFLVATHSPALVDRLRPEEFVVCERDESGASLIPALSTERVREIVRDSEDLPLGELWFSGALGGGL